MKRIYFVFAALLLSLFTAADSYGAIKLRIMSFNIRCLNGGDAPENQWDQRADRVGEYINEVKPDLFGMQEVVYKQFEDVKARVKGYECIYAGRDDGKNGGEGTPIFYRPDKYRLIKSGHYWLSETPEKPTFGWKAACLRIALWAVFEDIKSGERFIYCNTHFDHISVEARKQSAMLAKDRMRAIDPSLPFIFSADFNTNEKEETYSLLINHSYPCLDTWKAAKKRKGGPATFNGWGDVENVEDNKIDFIFTSEDTKVKRAVIAPPQMKRANTCPTTTLSGPTSCSSEAFRPGQALSALRGEF